MLISIYFIIFKALVVSSLTFPHVSACVKHWSGLLHLVFICMKERDIQDNFCWKQSKAKGMGSLGRIAHNYSLGERSRSISWRESVSEGRGSALWRSI